MLKEDVLSMPRHDRLVISIREIYNFISESLIQYQKVINIQKVKIEFLI